MDQRVTSDLEQVKNEFEEREEREKAAFAAFAAFVDTILTIWPPTGGMSHSQAKEMIVGKVDAITQVV